MRAVRFVPSFGWYSYIIGQYMDWEDSWRFDCLFYSYREFYDRFTCDLYTITFNSLVHFIDTDTFSYIYGICCPISLEIMNNEKLWERDSRYSINAIKLIERDSLGQIPN